VAVSVAVSETETETEAETESVSASGTADPIAAPVTATGAATNQLHTDEILSSLLPESAPQSIVRPQRPTCVNAQPPNKRLNGTSARGPSRVLSRRSFRAMVVGVGFQPALQTPSGRENATTKSDNSS